MGTPTANSLPDGWERVPLSAIIADLVAGVSVNGEDRPAGPGEVGVLKVSAVSEGRFRPEENKAVIPADRGRAATTPRRGDILISRSNTPMLVGAAVYVDRDHLHLYLPDLLWRATVADRGRDDPQWLAYMLVSREVRTAIQACATGTSESMKKISMASFRAIDVYRPPLPVQCRIVAVLDAWTRAEDAAARLIAAKTRLRDGLRNRLLENDHTLTPLADATEESRVRNNGLGLGAVHVRSVNKADGMTPMRERTIGSSLDRYKVVRTDWFAYNPMRLNIGSIARWHGGDAVLVSPDYVVFRCHEDRLDPDYLDYLRRSRRWQRFMADAGNGGVRVRIYYADLASLRVPLPDIAEQRRIAAVLNAADRELSLLRSHLDAVRRQKRGLMGQLLTGHLPVPE